MTDATDHQQIEAAERAAQARQNRKAVEAELEQGVAALEAKVAAGQETAPEPLVAVTIGASGGSFFYGNRTPSAGDVLDVPVGVARSWRDAGIARPNDPADLEGPRRTAENPRPQNAPTLGPRNTAPAGPAAGTAPAPDEATDGTPVPAAPHATPGAATKAGELGVDLADVEGTGEGGRVLAKDVERHARELRRAPETSPETAGE